MKKTTKALISLIFGTTLLSCVSCSSLKDLGGSMSGSIDKSWHKTDVDIKIGQTLDIQCPSGNEGDYVFNIRYNGNPRVFGSGVEISYDLYFNYLYNMQVYFVFDNGYKTKTEESRFHLFGDSILIDADTTFANNLYEAHIKEVWARTTD